MMDYLNAKSWHLKINYMVFIYRIQVFDNPHQEQYAWTKNIAFPKILSHIIYQCSLLISPIARLSTLTSCLRRLLIAQFNNEKSFLKVFLSFLLHMSIYLLIQTEASLVMEKIRVTIAEIKKKKKRVSAQFLLQSLVRRRT